jgi:hypothetical protein
VRGEGGNPGCKLAGGDVVAEKIRDFADELRIILAGNTSATVHDVSADPRVTEDHKHRLLDQDKLIADVVSGITTSGVAH